MQETTSILESDNSNLIDVFIIRVSRSCAADEPAPRSVDDSGCDVVAVAVTIPSLFVCTLEQSGSGLGGADCSRRLLD